MAFKLIDNPTFTHTVKIRVPRDGGFANETVKATYSVIPVEEYAKFDMTTEQGTKDFLIRAIVSLGDIVDENDEPLEYNDELRDRLLSLPYMRIGLSAGYHKGVADARLGN